jgi:cold shock CspA family protein
MVGQITSLNHRRFGYIEANGVRYFWHQSELVEFVFSGDLLGQYVEFDPAEGEPNRGPVAKRVRPIEGPYAN